MMKEEVDLIVEGANEVVTLRGGGERPLAGDRMRDLGVIKRGAVAVRAGRLVAVERTDDVKARFTADVVIEADGKVVMPGFVDPHTHLVFAGSREDEFEMMIEGVDYVEILRRGGGILRTVRETRKASVNELVEAGKEVLNVMLTHGTTTVEAKSGYGLNEEDEIKCLKAMQRLNEEHFVDVTPTFLGAHVVPPEYEGRPDEYVEFIVSDVLPKVGRLKLAEFCDVFCERGAFNVEQARKILLSGKQNGLLPKVHADELSQIGGAELAAEVGAVSADHLIFASDVGIDAMAKGGVIAITLPTTPLTLMIDRYADARKMINKGVAVALGTDFSPICQVMSQQLVIALACRTMRMTPAEAIVAATINAAHAVRRAHEVGSLEVGKRADFVVLDVPNYRFLGHCFGFNLVDKVVKDGELVVNCGKLVK